MMLFSLLLSHRGRPAMEVGRAVDDAIQRLALMGRGRPDTDGGVLTEHAGRLLAGDAFGKTHLFAHPERHEGAAAALPDDLWVEALLIGLRAVTNFRGFSICRGAGDFDPGHPEVKAEFLLQLVESLVRRVDAALF